MTPGAKAYLDAIGVTTWRLRGGQSDATEPVESQVDEEEPASAPGADRSFPHDAQAGVESRTAVNPPTLDVLRREVAACQLCSLAAGRTQTVFGTGNPAADWMIVGEAPGAEEDRQGQPFVGRAGRLLNSMIAAIGLAREDVYIANVLKCRPPNNRDPQGEEVVQCLPYLHGQIRQVRPRIILALGRFAAQALLESQAPISRLRGSIHHYGEFGTPLVVSYHPAYLLRSPAEKRKAWQDLKLAMSGLDAVRG